jgi:hypothetical protein
MNTQKSVRKRVLAGMVLLTVALALISCVVPTNAQASEPAPVPDSSQNAAQFQAQTGDPFFDLMHGNVPVGDFFRSDAWSLVSMVLCLLALLLSVALALGLLFPRQPTTAGGRRQGTGLYTSPSATNTPKAENPTDGLGQSAAHLYPNGEGYTGTRGYVYGSRPLPVQALNRDADPKHLAHAARNQKLYSLLRVVVIATGFAAVFVWLMMDDLSLPVVLINRWTPVIIAIFAADCVLLAVFLVFKLKLARQHPADKDNDT